MINRLLELSLRNRVVVLLFYLGLAGWGWWALRATPIDAIPDLSDNQVIVFSDWPGHSPQEVEDQVTYPLTTNLQGLAGVRVVRSQSAFGFSMIYVVFEDGIDPYFARTRVLERMSLVTKALPADVTPTLGPDATGVGHVFWYTVESPSRSLRELRTLQDWFIRYQLHAVPGVAEVASVGGHVQQYQIDVDPGDATRLVARPVFFSMAIILLAFIPVFALTGQEGKLFPPLAFTKTFAVLAATVIAVTLVPVLCTLLLGGRFHAEDANPVMRLLRRAYQPVLRLALDHRGLTITAAVMLFAGAILLARGIGSEFMPALNEGDLMFMPIADPSISLEENTKIATRQNAALMQFPEVDYVVAKVARADTSTDRPAIAWKSSPASNPVISWSRGPASM